MVFVLFVSASHRQSNSKMTFFIAGREACVHRSGLYGSAVSSSMWKIFVFVGSLANRLDIS
jgi:hypothetical protein